MEKYLLIINGAGLILGAWGAFILSGAVDKFLLDINNSFKALETTIDMLLHPEKYTGVAQFGGLDIHRREGIKTYGRKTKLGLFMIGLSFVIQIIVLIIQIFQLGH